MSFDLQVIAGDLVINNGQLSTVVDSDKLAQDILKICLTSAGSNPLLPWYGSFLSRTLIGNPNYTSVLVQIAKNQLSTALTNLQQLQQLQAKSFQRMSADEQLAAVTDISVMQSTVNPTLFSIVIKALTKGLKPITTNFMVNPLT
jgi:phage baseplate assembly protein W